MKRRIMLEADDGEGPKKPSGSSTAHFLAALEAYGNEYHLPVAGRLVGKGLRLDEIDGDPQR